MRIGVLYVNFMSRSLCWDFISYFIIMVLSVYQSRYNIMQNYNKRRDYACLFPVYFKRKSHLWFEAWSLSMKSDNSVLHVYQIVH